jgi:hypothetical protein
MARYRIICTRKAPASASPSHQHIVSVGTGTQPRHYTSLWTVDEVLIAMKRGDTFYTQGERSGMIAEVEQYHCTPCRRTYIRSHRDAVTDNNLDNLTHCAG